MEIHTVPYDFEPARFIDNRCGLKGYWVWIFCFFDGEKIHHFWHQSEYLENLCLAREAGFSCQPLSQSFLVMADTFPQIFQEIEEYVRRANSYTESEL